MSHPFPPTDSIWQHHKGNLYKIIARVWLESTGEPAVVCQVNNDRGTLWVRTLSEFYSTTEPKPRFTRVTAPDAMYPEDMSVAPTKDKPKDPTTPIALTAFQIRKLLSDHRRMVSTLEKIAQGPSVQRLAEETLHDLHFIEDPTKGEAP